MLVGLGFGVLVIHLYLLQNEIHEIRAGEHFKKISEENGLAIEDVPDSETRRNIFVQRFL